MTSERSARPNGAATRIDVHEACPAEIVAAGWGAQRVVLETTAAWTATVAFYESCGFRITHYVDGDFGRDAWFERRLGEPCSGPA